MAERATERAARRGRGGFLAGLGWLAICPVLAGVFTLGSLLLDQNEGLIQLLDLHRELGEMREQVQELERLGGERTAKIERLRSDPFEIETVARERLGMLRPGERVLRLENDAAWAH